MIQHAKPIGSGRVLRSLTVPDFHVLFQEKFDFKYMQEDIISRMKQMKETGAAASHKPLFALNVSFRLLSSLLEQNESNRIPESPENKHPRK